MGNRLPTLFLGIIFNCAFSNEAQNATVQYSSMKLFYSKYTSPCCSEYKNINGYLYNICCDELPKITVTYIEKILNENTGIASNNSLGFMPDICIVGIKNDKNSELIEISIVGNRARVNNKDILLDDTCVSKIKELVLLRLFSSVRGNDNNKRIDNCSFFSLKDNGTMKPHTNISSIVGKAAIKSQ